MRYEEAVTARNRWLTAQHDHWRKGAARETVAAPAGIAVGIIGREGEYRVAVRTIDRSAETRRLVRAIEDEVGKGQIDERHIGVAELLSARDEVRPLEIGLSCSTEFGNVGTIGCFVHRENTQSPTFLLSNAHVIARPADQKIIQPAASHFGDKQIALFTEAFPTNRKHNLVDAAIAEVDVATSRRIRDQARVLRGQRMTPTTEGIAVYKVGAATERTDGALGAELMNDVPVEFGPGDIRFFDDQLEIVGVNGAFADRGDSGSLVVDGDDLAVGLLFARSTIDSRIAFANLMGEVLAKLRVELA
ncbi:MAG TPA: hypothetical protein VF618_21395 [Thermoanaerobaculia bacterium]